jgi:diacylglycerol O-acyltransferase / wax synthase
MALMSPSDSMFLIPQTRGQPMHVGSRGQALNITVTSYVVNVEFGVMGCRRSGPHLQRLLGHLDTALSGLELAVG